MASPTPHLLQLPPELLLEVGDYLPPDGILALKLTHPILNDVLPALPRLRNRTLDACTRFAIERLRASPREQRQQLRCILCKKVYPALMFASSNSPTCLSLGFDHDAPRPEVVELPQGLCAWHVGRLARIIRTEPGGRNEWVSDVRRVCMHLGCVQGWQDCDCGCSSCGYKMVRTYTRFLNNTVEARKFHFGRNTAAGANEDPQDKIAGRLYVQEVCLDPSATLKKSIIQMPVQYLDAPGSGHETMRDRAQSGHVRRRHTSSVSVDVDKYTTAGMFLCTMPGGSRLSS